jgi:hypothetical protein
MHACVTAGLQWESGIAGVLSVAAVAAVAGSSCCPLGHASCNRASVAVFHCCSVPTYSDCDTGTIVVHAEWLRSMLLIAVAGGCALPRRRLCVLLLC